MIKSVLSKLERMLCVNRWRIVFLMLCLPRPLRERMLCVNRWHVVFLPITRTVFPPTQRGCTYNEESQHYHSHQRIYYDIDIKQNS